MVKIGLTSLPRSHFLMHFLQYIEMQHPHSDPPLQKFQSRVCFPQQHTKFSPSSQKPTVLSNLNISSQKILKVTLIIYVGRCTYHSTITTIYIHFVSKHHKRKIIRIRWICLCTKYESIQPRKLGKSLHKQRNMYLHTCRQIYIQNTHDDTQVYTYIHRTQMKNRNKHKYMHVQICKPWHLTYILHIAYLCKMYEQVSCTKFPALYVHMNMTIYSCNYI